MRLFLRRDGLERSLAQVGPDRIYFDTPVTLPSGPAELVVEIDGNADCTPIEIAPQLEPSRIIAYTRR